jgi:uncharacterized protein (DUF952 family)
LPDRSSPVTSRNRSKADRHVNRADEQERTEPPVETQGEKGVTTIYKICQRTAWEEAGAAGQYAGSDADLRDRFIHFSTATQLPGTAAKHFAGLTDLMLIAVDGEALGHALKWEPSRGGELFPHLYAALSPSAVLWARPLADEIEGRRAFPELVS